MRSQPMEACAPRKRKPRRFRKLRRPSLKSTPFRFGLPSENSLTPPATNISPTTRLSICFRTPVLRASPVVNQNLPAVFRKITDYRTIETFAIDYQIISLPNALPAQVAYPQMQLAAKDGITSMQVTRPRGTFLTGTDQDPRIPSIAIIDERGDCRDGLLAVGKKVAPGSLGLQQPTASWIIRSTNWLSGCRGKQSVITQE